LYGQTQRAVDCCVVLALPSIMSSRLEFSQGLGERCRLVLCRLPARGSLFHSLPLVLASSDLNSWQSHLRYRYSPHFLNRRRRSSEVPSPHISLSHEPAGSRGTAAATTIPFLSLWFAVANRVGGDTASTTMSLVFLFVPPSLLSPSAQRATTAGPARATHDDCAAFDM